jgi:hypothetical protein
MRSLGSWAVTMTAKVGAQDMQLHILTQDDGFTGVMESAMGNMDIAGTVAGNRLSWAMDVRKPMPIKLTCEVAIDGDRLHGTAKLGIFGKAELTGERIATAAPDAIARDDPAGDLPTGDAVDPIFNRPYVALREWRETPVPHHYVHGGFEGTDARFSFYFPPAEQYQGRFFHNTYPMATTSDIGPFPIQFDVAIGDLGFTADSGAYYVQTNLGGADRALPADPAIAAYRVNAAAARYSRAIAAEIYGEHRPYGYLFGGSGGSYQTIGSAENTVGIWDGFVPFVMATPNAIPSMFTIRMHALWALRKRDVFAGIVDAIRPGGSGDPYAGLDAQEAAALREASLLGYPLRGWWDHERLTSGYFYNVAPMIPMLDPTYVDDFWSKPGYAGADPDAPIRAERFTFDTQVAGVIDGFPIALDLAEVPGRDFADAHLVILDGASAGNSVPIAAIDGRRIGFALAADHAVLAGIRAGDEVRIDNAWPLALLTYHRHQLPTPDMEGWNQYRDADGSPLHPQRDILLGPIAAAGTAGSVPNGRIHGKMLILESLIDVDALPWQADWYRSQVKAQLGDGYEENFALWFIDHAQHDNPSTTRANLHVVSFAGALQQALRDVSAWVEQGVRPSETRYRMADMQVEVSADAGERGGVQPVVTVRADGAVRAEVAVGELVRFTATIEVPPGGGAVVAAEWDFEGVGDYPIAGEIGSPQGRVVLDANHRFAKPGTYFVTLRATSQRAGDAWTPYGRIQNLGSARVVVA